jgi:predicted lipoprotein
MNATALALFLALASSAPSASAQQVPLPKDVARFVERRDLCDHFRGEEPYDAERREFLEKRMRQYCKGTDAQLAALKRKYKARRDVIAKLNEYEAKIEGQ